ncbi:hypothetical protein C485_04285 [Natrinema altunense JCM 12890]|uniref:DUF3883 domain-containing protein n=1 Tax=Natrinema altunense (strain JCM 12890 / CGMCC 1.3731 / AJ2) TaxID=1227494 RepID=L9ZT93_NATA2|nr:hypothetical protein C485_04285 [Natrinema altunense JCM 12890]
MAEKRRFDLERASRHDARFRSGKPVEIKSTMHEHADGQPGDWKVYREYHEKLRRHNGWYCFVVYQSHGQSGCTVLKDKMVRQVTYRSFDGMGEEITVEPSKQKYRSMWSSKTIV